MPEEGLLDAEGLARYFAGHAPQLGVVDVVRVTRFPAGLSSLSYRADVVTADGPDTFVLRAEPERGVIPPYDIVAEHDLLDHVERAGLPVPKVLHLEADAARLGARFMVMSYVEGDVYRSADPRFDDDPELVRHVQERFVDMMARIHLVTDHGRAPFPDAAQAARAEVAVCRRRLSATQVLPNPVLEHALDVLDDRAPHGQLALLHGDYRLPNLKWRDGEIVGVLDWELARIGDPMADLAFSQTVGIGVCSVVDDLLDRYVELTGFEVDDDRLAYYHLLELTKSTIIGLAAARDLAEGGADLRLLSVAGLADTAVPIVGMLAEQVERVEVG